MKTIRVALVELPQMLADIVSETISRQNDLTLVGHYSRREFEGISRGMAVDVLIWCVQDDPEHPALGEHLLLRNPRLSIIALSDNARSGALHELKPVVTSLGEMFPEKILDTVRSARPVA